jgi:methylated-DNA-[protein]-cysteine S-methyltransferase
VAGGARPVGSANGRNPIAIVVPCHRVIGADGSLTGYAGGVARKRWLLNHEGVVSQSNQLELDDLPDPASRGTASPSRDAGRCV